MVEHPRTQVVHQALADGRRKVALSEPDRRRQHRETGDGSGEGDDEAAVVLHDALVDDLFEQQRLGRADQRVNEDEPEEDRELLLVGRCEAEDAPHRARRELVVSDGAVLGERPHRAAATHAWGVIHMTS